MAHSWSVILSANPGEGADAFAGVAVVSANDVWAVGFYEDNVGPSQTLIEHWNGTSWSVVGSPNVGTSSNVLRRVVVYRLMTRGLLEITTLVS